MRNQRVASKIAGSCAWSHASLGVMYAASSGLAARSTSRSASGPARSAAASASARRSSQVIAGASGRNASSTGTSVQPMPSTATAATSRAATPLAARTSATVPHSASHQRSGSISARTASGRSRSYVAVASATGTPPASQSAVFVLEVPWSTVTMYTFARVRGRCRPERRSYGGVMVPSRSHRSSQRWPAFQRNTWPLISRQSRSMPAIAAMSASSSGSPTAARRLAW